MALNTLYGAPQSATWLLSDRAARGTDAPVRRSEHGKCTRYGIPTAARISLLPGHPAAEAISWLAHWMSGFSVGPAD